ncbi:hypothetical protein [Roseivirga sp. E12]|uniref:hypothetical protein n=1 Tax=Roseivirga sp. E12 TaxID=2819237 RepID=UPI001ABCDCA7|nr:hypothetical protein [Roseivirga sp. E12]MBO3697796.1 hypothetical protein [Roseivirga sp. E12]
MRLAHYQIEQIKEYINDQNIWYDDVREEILDHVATAVEERLNTTDISFVDACAEMFREMDINKFQRQKLKYEHLATLKEVGKEMMTFLTGKKLAFLILMITATYFIFSLSVNLSENIWFLSIYGPVILMIYFIIIPTYARRFRVLYQSYYLSRINAIYSPSFVLMSVFGWMEAWLLNNMTIAIILFTLYHLFVVSGLRIMHKTLKQVKANVIV